MLDVSLDLAHTSHLRPNDLGGFIIRQSDLSAMSRCGLQKFYYQRAEADPAAPQPRMLSATVYGSVIHFCTMLMEQAHQNGEPDPLGVGLRAFNHYWHHDHVEEVPGVDGRINEWLPRQTYGSLRDKGLRTLRDYYDILKRDEGFLLGLEYQFAVPITVAGRTHTITGTVDRLTLRKYNAKPYLGIEDFKTGKQPTYLRYNMQGHVYSWATTQPEFWVGWAESGMGELVTFDADVVSRLRASLGSYGYALTDDQDQDETTAKGLAGRRFRWVDLKDLKYVDGGWRNNRDWARVALAVDGYVRACEAGAYQVNTTGEICRYCPFRTTCGGVGVDLDADGLGAP